MKLFNRGNQNAAVGPASAVAPPAEATPPAPPEPEGPDVAQLLESSVKDISEKVARLASSVETTGSEREAFEAKLNQMEDRMRKLSSLTEMISAQYNPFIGDAPTQRDPLPAPEAALAAPALEEEEMEDLRVAMPMAPDLEPLPLEAPMSAFEAPAHHSPPPAAAAQWESGVHVERFGDDFQSSLVLIKWADLLLQNAQSRQGVADLLEYYHNIGWLGDAARDQLHAYVEGIAYDEPPQSSAEWRASAEFHEISLLFLEKLKTLKRSAP